MIQLFRKVLCPIDFSEHSLAALDFAIKMAQQNDAKLYLLNVAPLPAGAVGFQPVSLDPYPYFEKERQEQLVKLAREKSLAWCATKRS
jgi:nucleotide-binding universal stress UspA family protein